MVYKVFVKVYNIQHKTSLSVSHPPITLSHYMIAQDEINGK